MSHGLVDELSDEDNGGDDARHEADGAHDNVEVWEIHVDAETKGAKEESQDEDPDTDYEVYCDHTHGPETILTLVRRCLWSDSNYPTSRKYAGLINISCKRNSPFGYAGAGAIR